MALIKAVISKDIAQIKSILNNKQYNVNNEKNYREIVPPKRYKNHIGPDTSALCAAAVRIEQYGDDYWQILHMILQHPTCDINWRDDRANQTALEKALICNSFEGVKALLSVPECDVSTINCLHIALQQCEEAVALLLDHPGSNVNAVIPSFENKTLLHIAVLDSRKSIVQQILSCERFIEFNKQDSNGNTALHLAVMAMMENDYEGTREILTLLLKLPQFSPSHSIVNSMGETPLVLFLMSVGNISLFHTPTIIEEQLALLGSSAGYINASSQTFALIVDNFSPVTCKTFLEYGADVDSSYGGNESALWCAFRQNSPVKVKILIEYGAQINCQWHNLTPLQYAIAMESDSEIIEILSKQVSWETVQKEISRFGIEGETPLTCSVRLGIVPWIHYFATKFDICQKDATGLSAVELAEQNSKLKAILLKAASQQPETQVGIAKWYAFKENCSHKLTITRSRTNDKRLPYTHFRKLLLKSKNHVKRSFPETSQIITAITAFVLEVSKMIASDPQLCYLAFKPLISGSTGEGTKTYLPDEFDIICEFLSTDGLDIATEGGVEVIDSKSPWARFCYKEIAKTNSTQCEDTANQDTDSIDIWSTWNDNKIVPKALAAAFYEAFRDAITCITAKKLSFGKLRLFKRPLQIREKISCLKLLWRGDYFKDMVISVDLVAAFKCKDEEFPPLPMQIFCNEVHVISKVSRHEYNDQVYFQTSQSLRERKWIKSLPRNIRNGLIMAKSLRIASISRPDNIEELGLVKAVDVDEIITSFMLKSCLLRIIERVKENMRGKMANSSNPYAYSVQLEMTHGDVASETSNTMSQEEKSLQSVSDTTPDYALGNQQEQATDRSLNKASDSAFCSNDLLMLESEQNQGCVSPISSSNHSDIAELPLNTKHKESFNQWTAISYEGSEFDWADRIYTELEALVESGQLQSYHDVREYLLECEHVDSDTYQRSCCLKRRLMLSLIRSIRRWLKGIHVVYERSQ